MAKVTKKGSNGNEKSYKPISREEKERRMISYAEDLAEKQLREGTATSQVITHYLKLGTRREELELEKLRKENELLTSRNEAVKENIKTGEMLQQAIEAFSVYHGDIDPEDGDEYDDDY